MTKKKKESFSKICDSACHDPMLNLSGYRELLLNGKKNTRAGWGGYQDMRN